MRRLLSSRPGLRPFTTSSLNPQSRRGGDEHFNYNRSSPLLFSVDEDANEYAKLPRLTAKELATYREPPRGVKTLVRDFIHDALYNPHYGYFSQRATIFSTVKPFDFRNMCNSSAFDTAVAAHYAESGITSGIEWDGPGKQLWHTPAELFQPWYGKAIAQCLVSEYLLKFFPYEDFVIYEMGGGNGTLALNILDYLREEYPEVYERTHYRIIEISPNLANIQREKLEPHTKSIQIINKSIFDWDTRVPMPCFFVALEVIDNFAHDVIRYSMNDSKPYQALTTTSASGDYDEIFEPVSDPLITKYLEYRKQAGYIPPAFAHPLSSSPTLRRLRTQLPFSPNLSRAEFLPTQLFSFLEILRDKFPLHHLLLSDFSSLPDAISGGGYNAPVVQTRYRDTMVPCSTYMVQPGYFDIFFPTDFELLRDMYELVMVSERPARSVGDHTSTSPVRLDPDFFSSRGRRRFPLDVAGVSSSSGRRNVYTHKDFLRKYSDTPATTLRSGENPMLDYYSNVKFLF